MKEGDREQPAFQPGRLRSIFDEVSVLSESERPAALSRLCGSDKALRSQIKRMLLALDDPPSFLLRQGPLVRSHWMQPAEGYEDTIDGYELIEVIDEGSFGVVWRARQCGLLEREVAIKILKRGVEGHQALARFENERKALALMSHPHIARVFGAGSTSSQRPYFAMELVNGRELTGYCKRHRLSLSQALALFEQVCHAVHHAHEHGFVHRDLKPKNVLVETHDAEPFAKVIDFGIAKVLQPAISSETLSQGNWLLGSAGYMSPEQVDNPSAVDHRSDVYSLGAILFELAAGSPLIRPSALRGMTISTFVRWMGSFEPKPPSHIRRRKGLGRSPAGLDSVVLKALARRPDERYASAEDLANDVRRLRSGIRVLARGWAGWRRPLIRAVPLRPIHLIGLAVLGATVVGGLEHVWMPWGNSASAGSPEPTRQDSPPHPSSLAVEVGSTKEPEEAPTPSLMEVITKGAWQYRDPPHRPSMVRFRPIDNRTGTFHDKHHWWFVIRDKQTIGVDFWNNGREIDVVLKFDLARQLANGEFTDKRGRLHRITLRRTE